jgi:hypothetical protein
MIICERCQRPIADQWSAEEVSGVTVPGGALLQHITCPPGTCASCGDERPYAELRVADLGGAGEDIPDLFACTNVVACQIRAGERDPDDLPQGYTA